MARPRDAVLAEVAAAREDRDRHARLLGALDDDSSPLLRTIYIERLQGDRRRIAALRRVHAALKEGRSWT